MNKEFNYRTSFERRSFFGSTILPMFEKLSSYPRLMIEVFLRKNFGPRYFSLSAALTLAVIMLAYPLVKAFLKSSSQISVPYSEYPDYSGYQKTDYFGGYETWYIFFLIFIGFAIMRRIEISRRPSTIDFAKHSQYMGDLHPLFCKIKLFGKPVSARLIETFFEPLVFFIIGYVLNMLDQNLGMVLMVSAVCYSLSYVAAYANATRLLQSTVDGMVVNEDLANTFADDRSPSKESQKFSPDKPAKESLRRGNIKPDSRQNPIENENITIAH